MVDDSLEKSDAIIILSDDNFYADRATRAAGVFRQGLAPVVVASGVRLRPYAGIAELMSHDLFDRGVPKESIIAFPQDADNTREEAEALKKLLQAKQWKSVIIVTSNYHTRRAKYICGKVFGSRSPFEWPRRAMRTTIRHSGMSTAKSVKRFVHEVAGYWVAWWELHGERS